MRDICGMQNCCEDVLGEHVLDGRRICSSRICRHAVIQVLGDSQPVEGSLALSASLPAQATSAERDDTLTYAPGLFSLVRDREAKDRAHQECNSHDKRDRCSRYSNSPPDSCGEEAGGEHFP